MPRSLRWRRLPLDKADARAPLGKVGPLLTRFDELHETEANGELNEFFSFFLVSAPNVTEAVLHRIVEAVALGRAERSEEVTHKAVYGGTISFESVKIEKYQPWSGDSRNADGLELTLVLWGEAVDEHLIDRSGFLFRKGTHQHNPNSSRCF